MTKMNPITKMIQKLDRPPAGPNFVRFIFDDPRRSAKAILSFAKGRPPFTYQTGYAGVKDGVEWNITQEAARSIAMRSGAVKGRESNASFVDAFFEYDQERNYPRSNPILFERGYFRVSREIVVPIAPLTIVRESGKFVPLFVCGWASLPLTTFQRRLLMTLYEDAFLSLTDFQESPAEILFFPKIEGDGGLRRRPEIWQRGDYQLLSDVELAEAIEIFMAARAEARAVLEREAALWAPPKPDSSTPPPWFGA